MKIQKLKLIFLFFLVSIVALGIPARVAHIGRLGAGGVTTFTTGTIDITGSTFCLAAVSTFGPSDNNITDLLNNTWIYLTPTQVTQSGVQSLAVFYTIFPVTGVDSFTVNNGRAGGISVGCYSGVTGILPFDKSTTATGTTTTLPIGPLTPANNGSLLITAAALVNGSTFTSVDSGFSIYDNQTDPSLIGVAIADFVQTSAAAITSTWTFSAGANRAEGALFVLIAGTNIPLSPLGYAVIAHTSLGSAGPSTGIVTTGANFCIASVQAVAGSLGFADNKGNSYTAGTKFTDSAADTSNQLFWIFSPIVGTGHTFTATGTAVTWELYCYSGIAGTLQSQTGVNATTTVMNPLSATTTPTGTVLIVVGVASTNQTGYYGMDSGFKVLETQATNSSAVGGAAGFYVAKAGTWAPSFNFFSAHKWASATAIFPTTSQSSFIANPTIITVGP